MSGLWKYLGTGRELDEPREDAWTRMQRAQQEAAGRNAAAVEKYHGRAIGLCRFHVQLGEHGLEAYLEVPAELSDDGAVQYYPVPRVSGVALEGHHAQYDNWDLSAAARAAIRETYIHYDDSAQEAECDADAEEEVKKLGII